MTPPATVDAELDEAHARQCEHDLADSIAAGVLPVVATDDSLPAGNVCHFASPVRFGRRRADQCGHLELTSSWLKFRAVIDVSVVWSEIADVQRTGREVIVTLADSTKPLHFWCPSMTDAARAAVLAKHFSNVCHEWA
jgi:hypothetical protein